MPIFTRDNPDGWIFRAERYFNINRLTEGERLATAGVSVDSDALSWLQWTEVQAPFSSWDDFKRRLLVCFRPSQDGSLYEQLLAIRQVGMMAEYRRDFEQLSSSLNGLSKEVMESTFVKRLRPEMKVELRLMKPVGLGQIIEMARLIEGRNNVVNELKENMSFRLGKVFTAQGGRSGDVNKKDMSPRVSGGFTAQGGREGF